MYLIPIIALLILIAIGTAWSPIFAVIIAVPAFIVFLAYVGFSRRADETVESTHPAAADSTALADERAGVWGEKEAG